VEGLSYLFTESAKKVVSQLDFLDSVLLLGFPDELNQLLLKVRLVQLALLYWGGVGGVVWWRV